jgi:hypothetical protein
MSSSLFGTFLKSLPHRDGYCVNCLSNMFSEAQPAIHGYLQELNLTSQTGRCGNCGEREKCSDTNRQVNSMPPKRPTRTCES